MTGKFSAIPSLSSAFDMAASSLVAVAGVLAIGAAAYAAYQWISDGRTYEGVAT